MKLVAHYIDPGDASTAKTKLCKAGIMDEIGSVDPHIVRPSKSGFERIGLRVVFDDQFEAAIQLLGNSDHVPKRIISLGEMNEIKLSTYKKLFNPTTELLIKAALIIIGACLLGFIVYTSVRVINDA